MRDIETKVLEYGRSRGLFDAGLIVAGVSGGPDSTALLCILRELSSQVEDFPFIAAVHVDHGIRGQAAKDDAAFTERLCRELDVPLKLFEFDVKARAREMSRGEEETGRILRYEAFRQFGDELAKERGIKPEDVRIAVAHHMGDAAETMMINLFRGTGLEGLTSMKGISGSVIRPLLCLGKDEITAYLEERGIPWCTDETNGESVYTRNKWRNEIFPLIGEASVKQPVKALLDARELLCDDLDFITSEARRAFDGLLINSGGFSFLPQDGLLKLHPAIFSRAIRLLREKTLGHLTDFETVHMNAVRDMLMRGGAAETTIDLPFGTKAFLASGYFTFLSEKDIPAAARAVARQMGFITASPDQPLDMRIGLHGSNTTKLPDSDVQMKVDIVENSDVLEYNTLSWIYPVADPDEDIRIVTGRPEAYFKAAGSTGGKELRLLLKDRHVPADARSSVVAVARGDRILWIPGIGHAEGFTGDSSRQKWERERQSDGSAEEVRLFAVITFINGDSQ